MGRGLSICISKIWQVYFFNVKIRNLTWISIAVHHVYWHHVHCIILYRDIGLGEYLNRSPWGSIGGALNHRNVCLKAHLTRDEGKRFWFMTLILGKSLRPERRFRSTSNMSIEATAESHVCQGTQLETPSRCYPGSCGQFRIDTTQLKPKGLVL